MSQIMIKTRNIRFVYDEAEICGILPKLTLTYFIKIPKSDDYATLMLEVLLQSKIQIYYAEFTSKKDYEYCVTKFIVSYNSLFLR